MAMYLCSGGSGSETHYDYEFINYNTKRSSSTGSESYYNIYTFQFGLFNSANANRDFEMLINFSNDLTKLTKLFILGSQVYNSIALGIQSDGSNKHMYLATKYIYANNSEFRYDDLGLMDGEDIIIKRVNKTIQAFHNNTKIIEFPYYEGNNRTGTSDITIGKMGDYEWARGIFNKFGFKWLS